MPLKHFYTNSETMLISILTKNPHPFHTATSSWLSCSSGDCKLTTGQKNKRMLSKLSSSHHETLPRQMRSSGQNSKTGFKPRSPTPPKNSKPTKGCWTYAWQEMTSIPTIRGSITSSHDWDGPKVIREQSNDTDEVYDGALPLKYTTKLPCPKT